MRVISQDDFNPRSREGSDEVTDKWMILKNYFNPRSREGSDANQEKTQNERGYFNPRSREGSDSNIIQQFSFFCIILYILSVIT